ARSKARSAAGGCARSGVSTTDPGWGSGRGAGSLGARLSFGREKWDYQAGRQRVREDAMTVAAVLGSKGNAVETITSDARLSDAVQKLGEKRIGALPVVDERRIVGIISERDVIYCLR